MPTPLPTQDRLPSPYRDETRVVAQALKTLEDSLDWPKVVAAATPWVEQVRKNPPPFWAMESLLKEYPISSAEGLALMRLAEALLRIPDTQTAVALAADQLGRANFDEDKSGVMASLSQQALSLSKKFLPDAEGSGIMGRLGAKTVVAATMRAVALLGKQFVLAEDIVAALKEADVARREQANLRFSFDMLGEGARTQADADLYFASYKNAIQSIASNIENKLTERQKDSKTTAKAHPEAENDGISIKLSALHPRYEWSQRDRVLTELVPRVWQLCELAAAARMNLTIDAEEVDRLELSLDVLDALLKLVAQHHKSWGGLGLAMQAYQTRSLPLIAEVTRMARVNGVKLMCRLVKGAYWDAEVKRAQVEGLPNYPVFTHKHHTDIAYLACARALLASNDVIYPQFATHNAATIAAIAQLAHAVGLQPGLHYELQRLHGMGGGIYREVLADPRVSCRVYAPVGSHRDLLAYLVRRLLENGANASFVHQLSDESVKPDALLLSPLRMEARASLVMPADLFAERGHGRVNSAGLDLAVAEMRAPILQALGGLKTAHVPDFDAKSLRCPGVFSICRYQKWSATPVAERGTILRKAADALQAQMPHFCARLMTEAHKTAADAVAEVREAVDFLRYYAVEAERIMQPIDLPGPTGESNQLRLNARGVWVCISPWNFPLAIFMGQVAAALATGNGVIAKPAEQTPLVAQEAVALLHAAGVPTEALVFAPGPGETVGAGLVALPGVAGVVFTGSTAVAKIIAKTLAAKDGPITPLIAETGGINCMVVDSSALPEQVVDAAIQSAFKSAGQRCSALRVLCVHEAVADRVVDMLQGAAAELRVGPGAALETDVGPLIDAEAYSGVSGYVDSLNFKGNGTSVQVFTTSDATNFASSAARIEQTTSVRPEQASSVRPELVEGLPSTARPEPATSVRPEQTTSVRPELVEGLPPTVRPEVSKGTDAPTRSEGFDTSARTAAGSARTVLPFPGSTHTQAPVIAQVPHLSAVSTEVFGPVLHVVRWKDGEGKEGVMGGGLDALAEAINATGYGLTLGIHTRIDSRAQAFADQVHIGNVYINRNIIGAVVGSQPFGGEGLSGTGPKAGGPHYLLRFCAEQTVTVNTTAAGGNVALLAG